MIAVYGRIGIIPLFSSEVVQTAEEPIASGVEYVEGMEGGGKRTRVRERVLYLV